MNNKNNKTSEVPAIRRPGGPGGQMGIVPEKPKNTWKTIKRILKYLGGRKFLLITLLIMVALASAFQLWSPLLQRDAIDSIAITEENLSVNFDKLFTSVVMIGIVSLIGIAFNLIQGLLSVSLSQKTVKSMRRDLFVKLSTLPIKYFDTHAHGDIMSRLTNDIDNVATSLSQSITSLLSSSITVIGALVLMIVMNPLMALITVLAVPAGLFVTKGITTKTRHYFKKQQGSLGSLNGHVQEMISGQKTVMAYSREKISIEQFNNINEELREYSIKAQIFSGLIGPLMNVISNLSFVLVAISGGWMAWSGLISVGTIQAFITLSKQFSRPINEIANQYNVIQSAIAGAERVFEIIDEISELDEGNADFEVEKIQGKVEFKDVNFGYKEDQLVLKNMSLDVKPGMKIALVGPTGAGKTTIVNLITRFYDINSGEIKLDGININDIPKDKLRSSIAIVLQDTVLFSGTIKDNIAYGRLDASYEEIEAAAKTANAHSFIMRLPNGYDTNLSEHGSNLSQGQRQLLSIARAVLTNPKILILDEATSSIDTRTEMHIQQAMIALMKGRTSFIIAHRLSTIRDSDAIIVIVDGQIAEQGSHEELVKQKGPYWDLYQTQFKRGKEDEAV